MTFITLIQAAKHSDFEKLILRELFDMYDKDKNEEITAEELRTKYAEMGTQISDTEVANIIGYMDTNSSDTVDFDEFCTYWSPKNKDAETKRSEMIEGFQVLSIPYNIHYLKTMFLIHFLL